MTVRRIAALMSLLWVVSPACDGAGPAGPGEPAVIEIVGGQAQNGVVGSPLSEPLRVLVTDASGQHVPGVVVHFSVVASGGTVNGGMPATTDAAGLVSVEWILGPAVGTQVVHATADALQDWTLTFTAVAKAGPAATITVSPTAADIVIGEQTLLDVSVTDAFGHDLGHPTWSSTNTAVAAVDEAGVVTGTGVGTATVSATMDGISGSATITVSSPPVDTIVIANSRRTQLGVAFMDRGDREQFTATVYDESRNVLSDRPVTWSIADESIATVSGDGTVHALAKGTTQITATADGKSTTLTLQVLRLRIYPTDLRMSVGDTVLVAIREAPQKTPVCGGDVSTWTVSDTSVVELLFGSDYDNRRVVAKRPGVVTITGRCNIGGQGLFGTGLGRVTVDP